MYVCHLFNRSLDQLSVYSSIDNINYEKQASLVFPPGIDSSCPQPITSYDLDFHGQYLKLVVDSYYDLGAGWQYMGIYFIEGNTHV